MQLTRRFAAAALVVALAACSSDDGDGERAATTTSSSTTTSSTATTTTTPPSTTAAPVATLGDAPAMRQDGPSGSGCTPGGALGGGWWFGALDAPVGNTVELDLACFYIGDAAHAEARARGFEMADNDYWIVNDSPTVRSMPLAGDATATCITEASAESAPCAPTDVDGAIWDVWVRVQDGAVDRIVEQFVP